MPITASKPGVPGNAPNNAPSPAQQNTLARHIITRGGQWFDGSINPPAVDMWNQLNPPLPATVAPGTVLTFYVRNVGLVKRLVLTIKATVTAGATTTSTLTKFGLANLISNVTFTDLGNNTRINTPGWHLTAISTAKRRRVFGAAYTSDTPLGYGNNNNRVVFAPSTIAATTNSEIDMAFEIPFVKNDTDLRGAVFADVTQATMQVQVTLNPGMFVTSTADPTLAVYQSGGVDLATLSNFTWQVNQNYLDGLPRDKSRGLILPEQDIGTAYLLNTSVSTLPVVSQDNSAAFINARVYESLAWYYDNNGTLNVNGSDLNYIQLQSANFTAILRTDGKMQSLMERNIIMDDFPPGMHYLDFRHRPIDTDTYGNMLFILNPSSVGGSGAFFGYGWESFGVIGQVNQGGSIPSGG